MEQQKISVIGLGNLGLPLAVTFALSKFKVTAMDIDESKIVKLKNSIAPFEETGLQDALLDPIVRKNLNPTTDIEEAIIGNLASFIVVNTPSRKDGSFGLKYLLSAAEIIGKALKNNDDFHVVVVVSTVSPGDCINNIIPLIEKESGKKCNQDFGFVHNPELVALGKVINDMLHPDFRIIGESDPKSGKIIEDIYEQVSDDPIIRMSIIDAELTKIALNCYLTMKISFVNMLAEICQNLEGGNVDLVTQALGSDSRISEKFLKAGLGFGGPCFPRDNKALIAIADQVNSPSFIPEAVVKVNDRQVQLALERIKKFENVKQITVLGLSYKPDVPFITESQAFEITKFLSKDPSYQVLIYDPQAMDFAKDILGNDVLYASSFEEAINNPSDLIIVLTPWKEFDLSKVKNKRILNFWKSS